MTADDLIRRLHQHRLWANARLRQAATTLTDDQLRQRFNIGRGSLFDTLTHLYAAEFIWLEALLGKPNPPAPNTIRFDSLEGLFVAWNALDRRWQRFLNELTETRLDLPVHKTSTSGPTAGQPATTTAADALLHVATHAQYTTAQAVNILRQLGVPTDRLPDTQLITFARQQATRHEP